MPSPLISHNIASLIYRPAAVWPHPVILYFHHVGRAGTHYTSISLEEFQKALDVCESMGRLATPQCPQSSCKSLRLPILISFDDGYAETFDSVLPILQDRGVRAVFFINTAVIGSASFVPSLGRQMRYVNWDVIKEAKSAGHEIGSHGHYHRNWFDLTPAEVQKEATTSLLSISKNLGAPAWGLAYPYGRPPTKMPHEMKGLNAFGTIRETAAHWCCAKTRIRRVFLPARESDCWFKLISEWHRGWLHGACAICCDTNDRSPQ